jgi:hypothetical protein
MTPSIKSSLSIIIGNFYSAVCAATGQLVTSFRERNRRGGRNGVAGKGKYERNAPTVIVARAGDSDMGGLRSSVQCF